jgi:hypothetical protein
MAQKYLFIAISFYRNIVSRVNWALARYTFIKIRFSISIIFDVIKSNKSQQQFCEIKRWVCNLNAFHRKQMSTRHQSYKTLFKKKLILQFFLLSLRFVICITNYTCNAMMNHNEALVMSNNTISTSLEKFGNF